VNNLFHTEGVAVQYEKGKTKLVTPFQNEPAVSSRPFASSEPPEEDTVNATPCELFHINVGDDLFTCDFSGTAFYTHPCHQN